jgi:hypothetical protein
VQVWTQQLIASSNPTLVSVASNEVFYLIVICQGRRINKYVMNGRLHGLTRQFKTDPIQ